MSENDQRERLFRTYADLAVRLTLTSFTIQCTQKAILQLVMDVHHKKIDYILLPLQQFRGDLSRIIARASPYACTLQASQGESWAHLDNSNQWHFSFRIAWPSQTYAALK